MLFYPERGWKQTSAIACLAKASVEMLFYPERGWKQLLYKRRDIMLHVEMLFYPERGWKPIDNRLVIDSPDCRNALLPRKGMETGERLST